MVNDDTLAEELAKGELTAPAIDIQPVPTEAEVVPTAGEAGYITLRMPRTRPYEDGFEFPEGNLDFGPAGPYDSDHDARNIKFRSDGEGPGYAIVREDHPLLGRLQQKYPQVQVVDTNPVPTAYVCDVCDKELATKKALATHKKSHK